MNRDAFERLVEEGFGGLPEWVRSKIRNVALLIEDEPSEEVRRREGLDGDETLLGYYQGIPLSARGSEYGVGMTMPDTITLYQFPIEDEADALVIAGRAESFDGAVRKVVAETIWHEYAHHFGMDEAQVRFRERERDGEEGVL